MKLPALQTILGVAAVSLSAAGSAVAVDINPEISLSGYLVGSAKIVDADDTTTTLDLDATKLVTTITKSPVSATASLFASGTDNISLLDAYFTYAVNDEFSITAGKFLSYHGYEAFDIPNMLQITYSNENLEAIIPGYHKGVKFDASSGDFKFGAAVLDSVYDSDGEIEDGIGFEGYVSFSANDKTAYLGVASDSLDLGSGLNRSSFLADLWVQWDVSDKTMVAGEYAYKTTSDDVAGDVDSMFVSGLVQWKLSENSHALVRVCWGEDDYDGGPKLDFTKYTLAFRQKVSDNFTVVEEASYSVLDSAADKTFLGVQGRFTF